MPASAESDQPEDPENLLPDTVTEPEWAGRIRRPQERGERLQEVLARTEGEEDPE